MEKTITRTQVNRVCRYGIHGGAHLDPGDLAPARPRAISPAQKHFSHQWISVELADDLVDDVEAFL
ncbi:MAG: hypothetical protein AB7T48_08885, partial [Solirubrobacterales bacterium]